jgi:hypothetical protein
MSTGSPPEFDPAKSIEAVRFEHSMAVETATRVGLTFPMDFDEFITNVAFLESFLVHARNLDEFLSSRGWKDTDVKASDFVTGFPPDMFALPEHR